VNKWQADCDRIPCWLFVLAMLIGLGSLTYAFGLGASKSEQNRIERLRTHGERCRDVSRVQCPDVLAKVRGGF